MATSPKSNSQVSTLDDEVVTPAAAVADAAVKIVGENDDGNLSGKFELVTIHSSNDDGGTDAVFVGHNGYAYQIPRNAPFKVPTEVVQILRDAVTISYKPGAGGAVTERSTPRYAFSSVPA